MHNFQEEIDQDYEYPVSKLVNNPRGAIARRLTKNQRFSIGEEYGDPRLDDMIYHIGNGLLYPIFSILDKEQHIACNICNIFVSGITPLYAHLYGTKHRKALLGGSKVESNLKARLDEEYEFPSRYQAEGKPRSSRYRKESCRVDSHPDTNYRDFRSEQFELSSSGFSREKRRLNEEERERRRDTIQQETVGFPVGSPSKHKKKRRPRSPSTVENAEGSAGQLASPWGKLGSEERGIDERTRSASNDGYKSRRKAKNENRYKSRTSKKDLGAESKQSRRKWVEPESVSVLTVARHLSTVDDHLGSLAPKITSIFSRVVALEGESVGSSNKLLDDNSVRIALDMAKEKCIALLDIDSLEKKSKKRMEKAIQLVEALNFKFPVKSSMPSIPLFNHTIDNHYFSQIVADIIVSSGRPSLSDNELQSIIVRLLPTASKICSLSSDQLEVVSTTNALPVMTTNASVVSSTSQELPDTPENCCSPESLFDELSVNRLSPTLSPVSATSKAPATDFYWLLPELEPQFPQPELLVEFESTFGSQVLPCESSPQDLCPSIPDNYRYFNQGKSGSEDLTYSS
ncbi:uncharacterized protein LOC136027113 [Artemia franciscana]|uniref:Uncharacterized protein n=1 Tax=Artemia franciscana TaxID=6661 RepID=A0AA88KYL3_ARTSF|nr:hypothetical protein QYM36_013294 [Artemia franciscana]KAK2709573.1 hypothetical protein QYM36_013294 [Artemia franciscana]KAK2709574.1 hypothetical protein QYM36_013294 [Artemia franciscana]